MYQCIEKHSGISSRALEVVQKGMFWGFYLLSLRVLLVGLCTTGPMTAVIYGGLAATVVSISWWNTSRALRLLVMTVPLVNGMQIVSSAQSLPLLSMLFASLYLLWLPKRLLGKKKGLESPTGIGEFIDLLAGIVMISLLFSLSSFPGSMVAQQFVGGPFVRQYDGLYVLDGAFILLQGLFFFRMAELEISRWEMRKAIPVLLSLHCLVILFFGLIQWIFRVPEFHAKTNAIFSPFNDPHSFGSYIVLLFLYFMAFTTKESRNRLLYLGLTFIAAGLLFFSGSRIAWIAGGGAGLLFLMFNAKPGRTIAFILVCITALSWINLFPSIFSNSENRFVKRLESILMVTNYLERDLNTTLSGRLIWWDRAINIVIAHPLTGRGIGSFFSASQAYISPEYDAYRDRLENAHNYYLQLAADLGIPGILVFFTILYLTYQTGFLTMSMGAAYNQSTRGLLFGLGAYLITMITGHPLLLSDQQFLFWFIVAAITVSSPSFIRQKLFPGTGYQRYHILVCVCAVGIVLWHMYMPYNADSRSEIRHSGFYGYEKWGDAEMRWTRRQALTTVKATDNILGMKVTAAPYNSSGADGLEFKLFLNDQLQENYHFFNGGTKHVYLWIPSMKGTDIEVKTHVSRTFSPSDMGLGDDDRDLGIAVSPISFLRILPEQGTGFFPWETMDEGLIPGWPLNSKVRYRWTGMQASMNLSKDFPNDRDSPIAFFLLCSHPDIEHNPIKVRISGDSGRIREEVFGDHQWRKIVLSREALGHSKVITLRTNRTWNPKIAGVSGDSRDLGVAVAVFNPADQYE